jgi:hypothetical protein
MTGVGFRGDLSLNSVQNAVDETSGISGSKSFSKVNGLIEGYFGRDIIAIEQFKRSDPEDRTIDHGHPIQAPMLGVLLNELIDLATMFQDPDDDLLAKFVPLSLGKQMGPQLPEDPQGILSRDVPLIKSLEGKLPRFPPLSQTFLYPFAISFKRLAISIADMAASNPLLPAFVPALSIACSIVSVMSTPQEMGTSLSRLVLAIPLVTSAAM